MELLSAINAGKIQLPDFQRGWVWDDQRIRALIASLINSYPIGAVMFLDYGNPKVRFQCRMIEGAPARNIKPENLILDGQQRLTAIYDAMFSKNPVKTKTEQGREIECYYYLDIVRALDSKADMIDAVISVSEDKLSATISGRKETLDLRTPKDEYEKKFFPLNIIFSNSEIRQWSRGYDKFYDADSAAQDLYTSFDEKILGKLTKYVIPVMAMEKETPLEAVCQVFENVNTGGVSLTVFELVTATFAMENFRLREDWEKRSRKNFSGDILNAVTATDFLGACTLLTTYKRGTINYKRKEILKLKLEDYKNCAENLTAGFVEAEKFLQEERIFSSRDLPYTTQLIPLAVLCTLLKEKNLIDNFSVREKLRQWYWCGVFGELYSGVHETRSAADVPDVMNWICNGGNFPRTIRDCYFAPMRLISLQSRNSAAYKGFMALILKNSARDFRSGKEMGFIAFYKDKNVDIHHIFPQKYCREQNLDKARYNSVINKTPISSRTNRIIGGGAPQSYIEKILTDTGMDVEELRKILESHWIYLDNLRKNEFGQFLANRASYLLDAVEKVTGKKILGRDSDEVIKFFGRAI